MISGYWKGTIFETSIFLSSRKKIRQENIQFLSSTIKIFKQDHAHIS